MRAAAAAMAVPAGLVEAYPDVGDEEREPETSLQTPQASEVIVGRLSSVKEFSAWAVGSVWTEDRTEIRVTGESLVGLKEGLEYRFTGRANNHSSYGHGFEVTAVAPEISPNDTAIQRYLMKSFQGIGEIKARNYVEGLRKDGGAEAVEALRQKLLNEPWTLDLTKIAKGAKFNDEEDPQSAMKLQMVTRNLMLSLGSSVGGLREGTAKLLAQYLINMLVPKDVDGNPVEREDSPSPGAEDIVSATWAELVLNPYAPIRKVQGYGFLIAESIASYAGIPKDSPMRLSALVEYAVEEGCRQKGHSFLRTSDFVDAMNRIDPSAPAQKALVAAIGRGFVVIDQHRVYPSRLLEAEQGVAKRLAALMKRSEPLTKRSTADVHKRLTRDPGKINEAFKDGFDLDQLNAISGIMTSPQRLHVLTGGPGTGKTAIIEVLATMLPNKNFSFCGPTGRAAKVLTGRIASLGHSASTNHSLLKGSEETGFEVNETEPLDCDILVVDENTMNGLVMANALLSAISEDCHVIFMGDPGLPELAQNPGSARAGQLPSISPGRFMQDLLLLPGIQHQHLTKTYRNSGGILEVVEEVSRGNLDTRNRESVKFSGVLAEPAQGFPVVMAEYLDKVARFGIENTYLVMSMRKGDRDVPGWNTTFANQVLRKTCNPNGIKLPGTTLHIGDRIMVRDNMRITQPKAADKGEVVSMPAPGPRMIDRGSLLRNSALVLLGPREDDDTADGVAEFFDALGEEPDVVKSVVNGDTGTITAYTMGTDRKQASPKWIRLALDDGQTVEFPGADAASLDFGYAGTVHSAQGSEYKHIIMVVTPGAPSFMNQNMIFTGFSRARDHLSIWGDSKVIRKIAATPMPERNSGLVERVKASLEEANSPDHQPLQVDA